MVGGEGGGGGGGGDFGGKGVESGWGETWERGGGEGS